MRAPVASEIAVHGLGGTAARQQPGMARDKSSELSNGTISVWNMESPDLLGRWSIRGTDRRRPVLPDGTAIDSYVVATGTDWVDLSEVESDDTEP
jgi:hypothetical protein